MKNNTQIMKHINLENIFIEEFREEDVLKLKNWGIHQDLRFEQYSFDKFYNDQHFYRWYEIKTRKRKKIFAIKEVQDIRGYISLRDINLFNKSAVMGISIDPNYISRHIGKTALNKFLEMYFEIMNMKTLKLKVVLFNKRAINLYLSLGFIHQKTSLERFENQMNNFKLLLNYRDNFKQIRDYIYTDVSTYKLTKNNWQNSLVVV